MAEGGKSELKICLSFLQTNKTTKTAFATFGKPYYFSAKERGTGCSTRVCQYKWVWFEVFNSRSPFYIYGDGAENMSFTGKLFLDCFFARTL